MFKHWLAQSNEDLKSAEALFIAGRYTWCAFICQQTIEKVLKAAYVKIYKKIPPHIHKLERLCQLLEIVPPEELLAALIEIDKYYIASRYPSYIKKLNINNRNNAKSLLNDTKGIQKWIIKIQKLEKR
ncbi:HEPN domain-containing protein [Candidatus Margulisiibacteriota bacterium]